MSTAQESPAPPPETEPAIEPKPRGRKLVAACPGCETKYALMVTAKPGKKITLKCARCDTTFKMTVPGRKVAGRNQAAEAASQADQIKLEQYKKLAEEASRAAQEAQEAAELVEAQRAADEAARLAEAERAAAEAAEAAERARRELEAGVTEEFAMESVVPASEGEAGADADQVSVVWDDDDAFDGADVEWDEASDGCEGLEIDVDVSLELEPIAVAVEPELTENPESDVDDDAAPARRSWLAIVLVVLVLGGGGAGIYFISTWQVEYQGLEDDSTTSGAAVRTTGMKLPPPAEKRPERPISVAALETGVYLPLQFKRNSISVDQSDEAKLRQIVELLKNQSGRRVHVTGFVTEEEADAASRRLGGRRSVAARNLLSEMGLSRSRFETHGSRESSPADGTNQVLIRLQR